MDEPLLNSPTVVTTMPTMVSRLPKFGKRPSPVSSSAPLAPGPGLANGACHPTPPARGTPPAARHNGLIRIPPSFSLKWRKGKVGTEDGKEAGHLVNHCHPWQPQSPRPSPVATQREVKKAVPAGQRARGLGLGVTSSSGSPQSSPSTGSLSSGAAGRAAKPSRTKPLGQNAQRSASHSNTKPLDQNAQRSAHPRLWFNSRSVSSSGYGSGSRPGSPFSNLPCNRSQSSDSLKARSAPTPRLSEEIRLRSQSLTQVRQPPSPTLTLPYRSSSPYQRGAERSLARPVTAKSPLAKPSASTGFKGQPSGTTRSGVATPTSSLLPQTVLKKSLLPSPGFSSKSSSLSYRLSRPSLIRQPRPFRVGCTTQPGSDPVAVRPSAGRRDSLETPPATPSSTENSPGSTPEAQEMEAVAQGEVSILGEALEDMSLSSTSSLERNDTSEEYMDDFDNLGNGGEGILLHSTNYEPDSGLGQSHVSNHGAVVNGVARVTGLHRFLTENMDWPGMALSGGRGDQRSGPLQRSRRGSSQPDYQQGSSLDLSPADSTGSGGTYIWDEEGLEPLGSASISISTKPTVSHCCGSFNSDVNSTDILNNLDNLESCDLDDDDLMLDDDLPEDGSLHSDNDGIAHLAKWRWKPLCWDTQEVHEENSLAEYEGGQGPRSEGDRGLGSAVEPCCGLGSGSVLGLDVEELAEDCCAVRSQLEHLQRLLQEEEEDDDELEHTLTMETQSPDTPQTSETPESSEASGPSNHLQQVEELLKEVQMLRQELKCKDQTITQLTLQLAVPSESSRCRCGDRLLGREDVEKQRPLHDQTTQTPWREPAVILPAPFLSPPWQYQRSRPYKGKLRPRAPSPSRQRVEQLVQYFCDISCLRYYSPVFHGSRRED